MFLIPEFCPDDEPGLSAPPGRYSAALRYGQSYAAGDDVSGNKHDEFIDDLDITDEFNIIKRGGLVRSSG